MVCFYCGKAGHTVVKCPDVTGNGGRRRHTTKKKRCFVCNIVGHLRAKCPNAAANSKVVTQMSQAVKVVPVKSQRVSVNPVVVGVAVHPRLVGEHDDVTTVARQSSGRTAVGLHQFTGPSKLCRRDDEAKK